MSLSKQSDPCVNDCLADSYSIGGVEATCEEEELLFDNSSLERQLQRQRLRHLNGYVSVVLTLLRA